MDETDTADRIAMALSLCETGELMLRARLRQDDPEITDAEIDRAVRAWLLHRPGAEHGDMPGTPTSRFA